MVSAAGLSAIPVDPYVENAFHILGLSVTASSREIRRRGEELRLQAELNDDDPAQVERIRSAVTTLDDPVRRLSEELFWLHLPPDHYPSRIVLADASAVPGITGLLLAKANQGSDEAAHDLAVLWHSTAMASRDPNVASWRRALRYWHEVWVSERFWDRMRRRAVELDDPRVTDDTVAELRATLPLRVLEPSVRAVRRSIQQRKDDLARQHLSVIVDSRFPEEVVASARARAIEDLRSELQFAIVEFNLRLSSIADDEEPPESQPNGLRAVDTLQALWQEAAVRLVPLARRLLRIDPNGPESAALVDDAAEIARVVGVRLHNEAHDSPAALTPLEAAKQLATATDTQNRVERDLNVLHFVLGITRAYELAAAGDWDGATQRAQEALRYASSAEQREKVAEFQRRCALERARQLQARRAPATQSQQSAAGGISWWVWAIVVLLASAVCNNLTSSSSKSRADLSPTSQPAVAATTVTSTAQPLRGSVASSPTTSVSFGSSAQSRKQELRSRMDQLKLEIDLERPTVELLRAQLDAQESDLDALESRLKQMQVQYGATGAPSDVVQEYDRLRRKYNGQVQDYNADLIAYKTRAAELNRKVGEYNDLLSRYKALP